MNKLFLQFESLQSSLLRPVDASTIAAFRILFGSVMVWGMSQYFYSGRIGFLFIDREFHFTYPFLSFIKPWPGDGMYYHFALTGFAAFLVAIGLFYRFAIIVFFLGYTYIFLIDQGRYNNHYYLISLMSFLMCFTGANQWMARDGKIWPRVHTGSVPYWQIFVLKAQIFIVYFYGGLAKINPDWLRGEPMRHWLEDRADYPVIGPFLTNEFAVYFFSVTGDSSSTSRSVSCCGEKKPACWVLSCWFYLI